MRLALAFITLSLTASSALAIEGPTAAGPSGGSDIRSAILPPPGLYGGFFAFGAQTTRFVGEDGRTIPALADAQLEKFVVSPFLFYVAPIKVFGGSIGLGAIAPFANISGHLFPGEDDQSTTGAGDPYVEAAWSRSFGVPRPSSDPGAYPIIQGLSVQVGIGAVIPAGKFNSNTPTEQATSPGTNIWDVAPSAAITYTTIPLLCDGTEISAKIYWNNYFRNPETQYLTGDLITLDFALTEHIGRFQVGLTGTYAMQIGDDERNGMRVAPNGNRGELLAIGGVVNYDLPEAATSIKFKAGTSTMARNTVESWSAILSIAHKF